MAEAVVDGLKNIEDVINRSVQPLDLNPTQQDELHRLVRLIELSDDKERGVRFVENLSRLPIDASTLIAGLAFCAITGQLYNVERVKDRQARDLVSTLLRLTSVDSAAHSSTLIQVKRNRTQTENVRGMLVAMIDDPRVMALKFVERLIELKVPRSFSEYELIPVAEEILNFYAPLASRLGIWHLKWVLEDAAFQVLESARYREIASLLDQRRLGREERVSQIQSDLSWRLHEAGVSAEIQGRVKNIYGIHRKMKEKNLSFSEVYDVTGIRVLVDSVPECYQVLGIVHLAWPHLANEFDDYIANPKSNGYRSLHTAVYGPQGHIIEVQIRTHLMHLDAELGMCSHWDYKSELEGSLKSEEIDWMREVLNWHEEFLAQDQRDIAQAKVGKTNSVTYVQTPKRHVVDLPAGSTVLDFAFKVHSEIGIHCVRALVDGQDAALNQELVTGQVVEIFTEPESEPQRRWLDPDLAYFRNPKTRDILRSHFLSNNRQVSVDAGKDRLVDEIRRLGLNYSVEEVIDSIKDVNSDEFLIAVSVGTENVKERLLELEREQTCVVDDGVESQSKQLKRIQLIAVDRKLLARDIMTEIASHGVNVVNLQMGAPMLGQEAKAVIDVEVDDLAEASLVVARLRRIRSVRDVWISKKSD